ncbi:MAG: ABC transporter substrate-binding protein [Desulfotignum sp.]
MENHFPDIRIGHLKIVDHLLVGMAAALPEPKSQGSWRLMPVPMQSWDEICDGLQNHTIHGACITTPLALELFGTGMDIRFLMFVHRSGSLMVKSRKANIRSLADFTKNPVLIPEKFSIQAMLLHKMFADAGLALGSQDLPETQVNWEMVPPYLMPVMLLAEDDMAEDDMVDNNPGIGGFMAPEPFGSLAVKQGQADQVCISDSLWKNHPCCGLVVTGHFLQTYPQIPGSLVTHLFNTARHLEQKDTLELVSHAADFLDQDPMLVKAVLRRSKVRFAPKTLVPDTAAIDMIQCYMIDAMKIMPQKIDLDSFVDTTWAQNALTEVCSED